MKALVVYDSFFSNTERIAPAIGAGLGSQEDVRAVRVDDVKAEGQGAPTLLVVGAPTRAFRPAPRMAAFLGALPKGELEGVEVAAFDTRIDTRDIKSGCLAFAVNLFGHAAKPIAGKLQGKGGQMIAAPEGFFVADSEGPLKEGEL